MDDPQQDLEKELKSFRLSRPAEGLVDRVAQELAAAPTENPRRRYASATSLTSWKWLGWRLAASAALLAVAATVAVSLLQQRPATSGAVEQEMAGLAPVTPAVDPAAAATEIYRPVSAATVLYELKDEGTVTLADRQLARQARFRYVDTVTWSNPRGNASLKMSVPRDEVRMLPARFN